MAGHERRRQERKAEVVPVSVVTTGLAGHTVNVSSGGMFFIAYERLQLVIGIKGKEYRGQLVRAFPTEDGMTGYAVELEECIETTDTPVRDGVPAKV